jgi:hypothetical protein
MQQPENYRLVALLDAFTLHLYTCWRCNMQVAGTAGTAGMLLLLLLLSCSASPVSRACTATAVPYTCSSRTMDTLQNNRWRCSSRRYPVHSTQAEATRCNTNCWRDASLTSSAGSQL